jgi:hypothetical protein
MDWVFKSPDNTSIVLSMFMVLYDGKLVAVELFASSAALSNDYAVRKTYMSHCTQLGIPVALRTCTKDIILYIMSLI